MVSLILGFIIGLCLYYSIMHSILKFKEVIFINLFKGKLGYAEKFAFKLDDIILRR